MQTKCNRTHSFIFSAQNETDIGVRIYLIDVEIARFFLSDKQMIDWAIISIIANLDFNHKNLDCSTASVLYSCS